MSGEQFPVVPDPQRKRVVRRPTSLPDRPQADRDDSAGPGWWVMTIVIAVGAALVGGFAGYALRAPANELARLNKLLNESRSAELDLIDEQAALKAERDELLAVIKGKDQAIEEIITSGPWVGMSRDAMLLAFKIDRVDCSPAGTSGSGTNYRETYVVNGIDVHLCGPPNRLTSIECTGSITNQNFGKTVGYFMSTFASDWAGESRAIWLLRSAAALENLKPENATISAHHGDTAIELSRDGANYRLAFRPSPLHAGQK